MKTNKHHTSFPQLKYPSLRDEGLKDAVQWLEGKSLDDGAELLWRINDKLYDLNNFVAYHPGGRDWIELTKGTDITEAFECHHIHERPREMLPKFYIREAKTKRNSPFTFLKDGFYQTLRLRIQTELDKIVVKSYEWKSHAITDCLFLAVLFLSLLTCFTKNHFILGTLVILNGLAISACIICSHNFFHKRDNWRMYLWNLAPMSYREWRVTHAMSHHLYPNTLMDIEISAMEPFLLFLAKPKPLYNIFVLLYTPFVYIFTFWYQGLRKIILTIAKTDYFKNHVFWHDLLPLGLPLWMYLVSGAPATKVLIIWIITMTLASFFFTFIGVTAAHHHPDIFHDGDEPINTTLDWGLHQLEAVMDCSNKTGSLFYVLTTFGDHALHHLFPTIDHAVLPLLYPTFYQVCEEFRTKHKLTTQADLILGQYRQLYRTQGKKRTGS